MANISPIARLPIFAATITSSCFAEFPAATALAVATVIALVQRTSSSGVAVNFGAPGDRSSYKQIANGQQPVGF